MVKTCQLRASLPVGCLPADLQLAVGDPLLELSAEAFQQWFFVLFQVKTTMNVISLQGRRRFIRFTAGFGPVQWGCMYDRC